MMVLEDLRLALRQICRAMGLPGHAATVVSSIVLGIVNSTPFQKRVTEAGDRNPPAGAANH